MKNISYLLLTLIVLTLSSCELIGGIFKAGVWTGIIGIALVLGVIIFLISRTGKRN